METALQYLSRNEQINFLLTNRIPRQTLTRLMGWFSQIESRVLTRASIAIWRQFATDLDLSESETQVFTSLRDCFTRRLKPGSRSIDAGGAIVASPCDAIVGECGRIAGKRLFQAKGFPYEIGDLIPDRALQATYRDGRYVTLRLKSSFYHRFHAPVDCAVDGLSYISGDTWNVNPIALQRIEKLYCRNERAVIPLTDTATAGSLCLVPVAAILVASMRFTGLDTELSLRYRGPNAIPWSRRFRKGDEMGYFQQGSTIILFATANFALLDGITSGSRVHMGQGLLVDTGGTARLPAANSTSISVVPTHA